MKSFYTADQRLRFCLPDDWFGEQGEFFLGLQRRNEDSGLLRVHTLELRSERPKTVQEVRSSCLKMADGKGEVELTERGDELLLSYSESQPAAAKVNLQTLEVIDLPAGTLQYSLNWQVWKIFSPILVRVAIFTYEFASDKFLTNAVSKDLDVIASCLLSLEFQN